MRGSLGTRVLVAAVLVLAGAAAFDAVRARDGDEERPATVATGEETMTQAAAALTAARVAGRLVFTDELCRLRALSLPDLRPTALPSRALDSCAFSLSPDGRRAASPGAVWSPDGRAVARCRGFVVDVDIGVERGDLDEAWDGCAPAWQRDGDLTVVYEGAIVEVGRCEECPRTRVRAAELARAARRHPNAPAGDALSMVVSDVAWLTENRVAALIVIRVRGRAIEPAYAVAFFERGRIDFVHSHIGPELTGLDASATGRFVVARPQRVLRRDGTTLQLPDWLRNVQAIAISRDEQWFAVATLGGIYLFRTWELDIFDRTGRSPRSIRVPRTALDIAWR